MSRWITWIPPGLHLHLLIRVSYPCRDGGHSFCLLVPGHRISKYPGYNLGLWFNEPFIVFPDKSVLSHFWTGTLTLHRAVRSGSTKCPSETLGMMTSGAISTFMLWTWIHVVFLVRSIGLWFGVSTSSRMTPIVTEYCLWAGIPAHAIHSGRQRWSSLLNTIGLKKRLRTENGAPSFLLRMGWFSGQM